MRRGPALLKRLRRNGPTRWLGAWVATLAVVVQLSVPLAQDPIGAVPLGPWLGFPLCHATIAGHGTKGGTPAPTMPGDCSLCPLCIALRVASAFLPPPHAPTTAAVVAVPAAIAPLRTSAPRLRRIARSLAQPRAPPV